MPAAPASRMRRAQSPLALLAALILALALCAAGSVTAMAQATPPAQESPSSGEGTPQPAAETPPQSQPQSEPEETPPPPAQPAQPATPPLADDAANARKELERLNLLLNRIKAASQRETISDKDLAKLRSEVEPINNKALQIASQIAPFVKATEDRLAQLGAAPKEGQAEDPSVAADRSQQTALREAYDGIVKQARLLAVSSEQLSGYIAERRRAHFTSRIFERRESALNPSLWVDVLTATPTVLSRFWLILSDWWGTITDRVSMAALAALALAIAAVALVLPRARRLLLRICVRDPALTRPSQLRRAVAAAWLTGIHILIPAIAALMIFLPLNAFSLLPAPVDRLFLSGARALVFFSLVQGLAWALLAPTRPGWRIVPLSDAAAGRVLALVLAAAATYALDLFFDAVHDITFAPLQMAIGKNAIYSLLIAVFLGLALITAYRSTRRAAPAAEIPVRLQWLGAVVCATLIAVPVAAALGYLALAKFLATQLVIGGTILGLLVLAMRLVDALLTEGLERQAASEEAESRNMRRQQAGIIASGVLRVALVILALFFLALPWGFETDNLLAWVRTLFFGFTIGNVTISPSSIMLAIVVFVIGIIITRAIQRWLAKSLLPHTRFDAGIRNSIRTAFGYAGIFIAAAIGFTFAGLDLSNLAIVAGALSVGIGFGLQSIVNNFVSGLILLAERPIKDGDWIVVGNDEGYVSKISVRSTQIETFDRATVIVPNSDLISGVVKNWMHSNQMGRVHIRIGVSYDSDPEQVREILLKCADEHPSVMKVPPPVVFFMDFGASSLDFELRAHIIQVDTGMTVRSELRFAIFKALREAGVEIPFPQQDVHFRDIGRLEKLLASAGEVEGKDKHAAAPRRRKDATAKRPGGDGGTGRKRPRPAAELEDAEAGEAGEAAGAMGDDSE